MVSSKHTVEIVLNGKNNAEGVFSNVMGMLGNLGKVAAGLAVGAAAGVLALGGAIGKLAVDAASVDMVRQSFDALTASIGETSDTMLADLRSATNNMVADADLMKSANQLISMGLANSSEEAAKLSEMAVRLGGAMGGDAVGSMEAFALMLSNQSIPRLDSFGISSAAVRGRIDELMSSTQGLTREEAFLQAVMEQGTTAMERLGTAGTEGAAVSLAQLKATFENLKTELGSAFLPALEAIVTPLADLAVQYAPMVSQALTALGGAIENFIWLLSTGMVPLDALKIALLAMVPEGVRGQVTAVFDALNTVGQVITNIVIPAVSNAIAWLGTNLPIAAQIASDLWNNVLLPAFTAVSDYISTNVVPMISDLVTWIGTNIPVATQAASDLWNNVLLPAFTAVWGFIETSLLPLLQAINDVLSAVLSVSVTALAGIFENVLLPALQSAGNWISTTMGPILQDLTTWLGNASGGVDGIAGAVQAAIGWLQNLADQIGKLSLPDWMTPGSPTPWELGLRGINAALAELNRVGLNSLAGTLGGMGSPAMAMAGGGGGVAGPISVTVVLQASVSDDMDLEDLAWRVSEKIAQRLRDLL